jgi:hypothetical protein
MGETLLLGPLGRLMRIDVPTTGYKADLVEYGAEHVPLSGRRTKDVFSRRREFEIDTDGLTPRALAWFEMLYTEAIAGPLYLRESSRKNLLRARISSTASAPLTLNANSIDWTAPGAGDTFAGVASTTPLLPGTVPGGELVPGPSKALSYFANNANRTISDTAVIPVVPGEVLCFSAYKQSGSTPTLEIVPFNAALVAQTPVTGTSTVATTPNRLYVTYTVPTNGTIVAVSVQLRAATSGTYVTLAWQLESGSATPTTWHLGAGVPQVMMSEGIEGGRHGVGAYTDTGITLKEI